MWRMNEVIAIEYRRDRIFHIVFDDGLSGEIDFSEYIGKGPVFDLFRDKAYFRRAVIEGGAIAWTNGPDIAPETLYEKVEQVHQQAASK